MGKLSDGRAFPLSAETAPASLHVQSWVPRGAADSQRGRFVRGDPFLPEPHLCAVCRGIHVHGKTPHPQDFTERGQEIKRQMYVFLLLKKRFNDSKMYRHENNRLPSLPFAPTAEHQCAWSAVRSRGRVALLSRRPRRPPRPSRTLPGNTLTGSRRRPNQASSV